MNIRKNDQSFTLIELLIVIAIIGILAALIMVSVTGAASRARDGKRIADLQEIAKALGMYYLDNASFPSVTQTSQDTSGPVNCWGGWVAGTTAKSNNSNFLPQLVSGGYLQSIPIETHPINSHIWNNTECSYRYMLTDPGQCTKLYGVLYADLENPRPNPNTDQRPVCVASGGWGEGSTGNPGEYGYAIYLPEQTQ